MSRLSRYRAGDQFKQFLPRLSNDLRREISSPMSHIGCIYCIQYYALDNHSDGHSLYRTCKILPLLLMLARANGQITTHSIQFSDPLNHILLYTLHQISNYSTTLSIQYCTAKKSTHYPNRFTRCVPNHLVRKDYVANSIH